ncbi:MAG: NUDIX hydrolase [Patescibacteria group bacterium]
MKHVVVGIISKKAKSGAGRGAYAVAAARASVEKFLLIKSKKDFGRFTGYWYPPGGHLENGEDEKTALVREMKEELDVLVRPTRKIAETPGDVGDQTTHWWLCEISSGRVRMNDSEIADHGWFTKSDMEKMLIWPATRRCFEEFV